MGQSKVLDLGQLIDKGNLFLTFILTASSFYSIFTHLPKTYNSAVALQIDVLKHLRDVATVLLDLVCSVILILLY